MNMGYQSLYVPRISQTNKYLIISCGIIFILQSILEKTGIYLVTWGGLSLPLFTTGFIYQLLTYPFFQASFMAFLFNALILWFIGSDLERGLGEKLYLRHLILIVLGGGLSFLLISLFFSGGIVVPLLGLSGICFGLLINYGTLYGDRVLTFMLIFPMKARYFCWLLIGIELYMGFFSPYAKASWGHLGGMLVAFLHLKYSDKFRFLDNLLKFKMNFQRKKSSRHLKLVKDDDDEDRKGPKYWH